MFSVQHIQNTPKIKLFRKMSHALEHFPIIQAVTYDVEESNDNSVFCMTVEGPDKGLLLPQPK